MTYIIRHSERLDYYDEKSWSRTERYKSNPKDPPITRRGIRIASDASLKILENIDNIRDYTYIYTSPFSRCVDTSIVIATTIMLRTNNQLKIRVEYGLRELYPVPLQSVMDELLKIDAIFIKYSEHMEIFDPLYIPMSTFEETKDTGLNPLNEFYRPLDTIDTIHINNKNSIICTHGLNIASMHIKFSTDRITQISDTSEKKGKNLSSYCYTARIN